MLFFKKKKKTLLPISASELRTTSPEVSVYLPFYFRIQDQCLSFVLNFEEKEQHMFGMIWIVVQ